jgi:N-acetylneuraminic acid mutarotase
MHVARSDLAAAIGVDGTVYAIGGIDASVTYLNDLEGYIPATNTWTTLASMRTARADLAAVRRPNGRIYAIGGQYYDSSNVQHVLSTVEVYWPSGNSWKRQLRLALPHSGRGLQHRHQDLVLFRRG